VTGPDGKSGAGVVEIRATRDHDVSITFMANTDKEQTKTKLENVTLETITDWLDLVITAYINEDLHSQMLVRTRSRDW
jgi:hypothetical protein